MEIVNILSGIYDNVASQEGATWSGAFWYVSTLVVIMVWAVLGLLYLAWEWVDDGLIHFEDTCGAIAGGLLFIPIAIMGWIGTEFIRWTLLNIPLTYFLIGGGFLVGMFTIRKFRRFAKVMDRHVRNTDVHKKEDRKASDEIDLLLHRGEISLREYIKRSKEWI